MYLAARSELGAARRLLDAGCGTGWWLEQLARSEHTHATLTGLELLPERAEAARQRAPDAVVEVGDARRLPFATDRFDVVFLFTVLSSLAATEDAAVALGEAARVLAPGGVLVVWEPRLLNPFNRRTLLIRSRVLHQAFPAARIESRTLTLFPPLARRLGDATNRLYPKLAQIAVLRTHRLWTIRFTPPSS